MYMYLRKRKGGTQTTLMAVLSVLALAVAGRPLCSYSSAVHKYASPRATPAPIMIADENSDAPRDELATVDGQRRGVLAALFAWQAAEVALWCGSRPENASADTLPPEEAFPFSKEPWWDKPGAVARGAIERDRFTQEQAFAAQLAETQDLMSAGLDSRTAARQATDLIRRQFPMANLPEDTIPLVAEEALRRRKGAM